MREMTPLQVAHLLAVGILFAVLFAVVAEVWMARTKRFCVDCGQRLVERHARVGFNQRTGQVRTVTFRACPDVPASEMPDEWDDGVLRCRRAPDVA